MEDNLKKWVNTQRDEFEVYDFDPESSWNQISTEVTSKKKKKTMSVRWLTIAASLTVLIVAGAIIYPVINTGGDSVDSVFSGNYELAEARDYYTSEINIKLTAAKKLIDDPAIYRDIDELDRAFVELQNDLKDNADNEEVIIAMMENYQLKLKILDRILKHLKKENQSMDKSQNREVSDEII
ncbi:MAG: hypothetical protein WBA74_20335 [Cyclobacteriaceae bacterium]